ncbi:MAG: SUMF1/EgtB/PvdO family nonheme iron enzyme, partial [Deltaproteobacteria bacterium]|nr:SUMF1/EgtB/PvdO family nonheme iron enzyme [Deltaproteobacteria bacterium]
MLLGCSPAAPPAGPTEQERPPPATGAAAPSVAADAGTDSPTQPLTHPEDGAEPASKYARCETPPKGMVCVPGGPAVIGSDDARPNERPRHEVEVSTFYIDRHEVTNADYQACETAGACPGRILPDRTFLGPTQPAVPVTWRAARDYCAWAGKRLPTEAEWEKAARGGAEGRRFPWGGEDASCERAQTAGCAPNTTKPVGSFPAGAYGIHDLAGNGYEWVSDWASPCYEGCSGACGPDCQGTDPLGPCAGAPTCKGHKRRVLKGGSWRWAADEARGSWRRLEDPASGAHRLSARCATTRPVLATWPPLALTAARSRPADPVPPDGAQRAAFLTAVEDTDVLKLKPCAKAGEAKLDCRDPFSYITSNEHAQHVWLPYIQDLGGGYVGVGSDQSYSFIGAARSQWAWIFDYDPVVVRVHHLLRVLILETETPAELVARLAPSRRRELRLLVEKRAPAAQRTELTRTLFAVGDALHATYSKRLAGTAKTAGFGWLRNANHYAHVRLLYRQGRIQALKGNLLTDVTMPSIGKSARALGVPIRILYTSNADDQWQLPRQFQLNVLSLPFDDHTVALRTIYPKHQRHTGTLPWEYVVQAGSDLHAKFRRPGWTWAWWLHQSGHKA